jgi:hypothetical protein
MEHTPSQRALTLVKLQKEDYENLQKIKEECGFIDISNVIHQILQSQVTTEMISVSKVMNESGNLPVLLQSRASSGKSYFIKHQLLPYLHQQTSEQTPVLVIDTNNEYDMLKEVKSIRELDLSSNQQVRFVPAQHSIMGQMMVKALITELNMMLDNHKDALKKLILVIEEAGVYFSPWMRGFVYRSKHNLRKCLILTPDDCFKNLLTYTIFR